MAKKKTLEQLQETHSEMLATANDLGLTVPEDLKINFTDQAVGATVCSNLDALIREHRAKGEVAVEEGKAQNEPAPTVKPAAKKRPSPPKPSKAAAVPPKEKETKMVTKTTRSKARSKVSGKTRSRFSGDAKITWLGKDNPAKKGSGRYKRIEQVRKHHMKTMATFPGKGGTVSWCVARKLAKVS